MAALLGFCGCNVCSRGQTHPGLGSQGYCPSFYEWGLHGGHVWEGCHLGLIDGPVTYSPRPAASGHTTWPSPTACLGIQVHSSVSESRVYVEPCLTQGDAAEN